MNGEAVSVIRRRLREDETLVDRTTLSPDRVAEMLEMYLISTYFSSGGNFYEQKEGAAMGSPVSANLYMEDITLDTTPSRPRLWKRYVDYIFCILRKGTVEELLNHLNGIRPAIKFTVELEDALSGHPGQEEGGWWSGHHCRSASAPPPQASDPRNPEEDREEESRPPVMMIPYVAGISEDIRRVCRKFDISPDGLSAQC